MSIAVIRAFWASPRPPDTPQHHDVRSLFPLISQNVVQQEDPRILHWCWPDKADVTCGMGECCLELALNVQAALRITHSHDSIPKKLAWWQKV